LLQVNNPDTHLFRSECPGPAYRNRCRAINDGSGLIPLKKSFWKVAGRGSQE
jgi:hypothetical protein